MVAHGSDGRRRVWLRPVTAIEFQPLEGTEGASYPFWSPDSRALGFFADDEVKRIAVTGGPAETLSDAIRARGGAWLLFIRDNFLVAQSFGFFVVLNATV